MIQRLSDALETSGRSFNIDKDDIKVKKLPKNNVKNLELKINNAIKEILSLVERWQMVSVDPKDLKKIIPKMREKVWRRHHWDRGLKIVDEVDSNWTSAQVRIDLSSENFSSWRIDWMNFLLSDKKWKPDHVVASVYNIWWVRKILLLRDIAEHPILARRFLALILDKYRSVKNK